MFRDILTVQILHFVAWFILKGDASLAFNTTKEEGRTCENHSGHWTERGGGGGWWLQPGEGERGQSITGGTVSGISGLEYLTNQSLNEDTVLWQYFYCKSSVTCGNFYS